MASPSSNMICAGTLSPIGERVASIIEEDYTRMLVPGRPYIGASNISKHCTAEIAYALRDFPKLEKPFKQRLATDIGHTVEDVLIHKELVQRYMPLLSAHTLSLQKEAVAFGGHVQCHADAVVTELPSERDIYIIEIKSMRHDIWEDLVERFTTGTDFDTIMRSSHRDYYSQAQMMMGLMSIPVTLFLLVNKSTGVIMAGEVGFDLFYFTGLKEKAASILADGGVRFYPKPGPMCKNCGYATFCWSDETPEDLTQAFLFFFASPLARTHHCRACNHAIAAHDGKWWCVPHEREAGTPCGDFVAWKPRPKPKK